MPSRRYQQRKHPTWVARLWGVWLFLVSLAWAPSVGAGSASAELRIVGPRPEAARIQQVLERLLLEQGVEARFSVTQDVSLKEVLKPPVDATLIIARIFIDLREPNAITLYMSNARAQSFAFREVRVESGKAEVAREEASAIVDAAVRLLLAGGSLELSRERAEQALQQSRPGPGSASRAAPATAERHDSARDAGSRSLRPWGFYAASAAAADVGSVIHGPGLGLELVPGARFHPSLSLQYQLPALFEGDAVAARLSTLASRAGVAWVLAAAARSRLSLAASVGVDFVWLSPRALAPARVVPGESRWVAAAMLRPSLSWQYELSGWGLGAMGFVDVDPIGTRYTVRREQQQVVAFEPWRARPGVAVLVAW